VYVVERRDVMRVFVAVREGDAAWVGKGAPARVRVQALNGQEFAATVARTSYALDRTTRTLVAEIDLPNPQDRLRPGMYAFATINVEHPNALTLPASAVVTQGDILQGYHSFCFVVKDGKAIRTRVELGARNAESVEVLRKQVKPAKAGAEAAWENFTEKEVVVRSDLGSLSDGQEVTVSPGKE